MKTEDDNLNGTEIVLLKVDEVNIMSGNLYCSGTTKRVQILDTALVSATLGAPSIENIFLILIMHVHV